MTELLEQLVQVRVMGIVICVLQCGILGATLGILSRQARIERDSAAIAGWIREQRERQARAQERRRVRQCGTGSTRTPGARM